MPCSWLVSVALGGCGVFAIFCARWREPYRESVELHWNSASSPSKNSSCRVRSGTEPWESWIDRNRLLPQTVNRLIRRQACITTSQYTNQRANSMCWKILYIMSMVLLWMAPVSIPTCLLHSSGRFHLATDVSGTITHFFMIIQREAQATNCPWSRLHIRCIKSF